MATNPEQRMSKVRDYVEGRFPELRGVRPTVSAPKQSSGGPYIYTFAKKISTPAGHLSQVVRVTSDEAGAVLKVSVSR